MFHDFLSCFHGATHFVLPGGGGGFFLKEKKFN